MKQKQRKVASQPSQEQKAPKPEGYIFGRPTKYKSEYCQKLIEWMREGNSLYTFGTQCDPMVHYDTIAEWVKEHKDFSDAKIIGRQLEQLWWDNLHRRCAATGDGNMTGIVWAQKNKFPRFYKERAPKGAQQINLNASMDVKQLVANMQPDQMAQLIAAIEHKTLELEKAKDGNNETVGN